MRDSNKEVTFKELTLKYPDFPRLIILKLDLYYRGGGFFGYGSEKIGQEEPGPNDSAGWHLCSHHTR